MKFIDKIKEVFKKEEPKPEKKPISLTSMKLAFSKFKRRADECVSKYENKMEEKIQVATQRKMNGQDASLDIKMIAHWKKRTNAVEKRVNLFERKLELAEDLELQKDFIGALGEMSEVFKDMAFDTDEFNEISDKILEQSERIAEEQKKIDRFMEDADSVLDYADSVEGSDLSGIESNIDSIITRAIEDAQFSAEEMSAADVARSVVDKIKV
jgi:hypothetical protein